MKRVSKDEIVAAIKNMTVLELADLVKALEEELAVTAAAPVAMAGPATAPVEEAPSAPEEEKTQFDVYLKDVGSNKIAVIKAIREMQSLSLKEAKELAESAPKAKIAEGISNEEATGLKQKVEEIGATVEIR